MSRRADVIEAIKARLQGISVLAGFRTDAGGTVLVNELPEFGETSVGGSTPPAAIVLMVGTDERTWSGKAFFVRLPLAVMGLVDTDRADTGDAWRLVEDLAADIKQAIEIEDRRLGNLLMEFLERGDTEPLPREPGTSTMGVVVNYTAPFKEPWGG